MTDAAPIARHPWYYMRLTRAFAISLGVHLAAVGLLSSGRVYVEGDGPSKSAIPSPPLSVDIRPPIIAANGTENINAVESESPQAAKYFAPSEVDQRAEPLAIKPLIIPERAYLERKKGKVRLRAYIDEAGRVLNVDILFSEPEGIFEQAAVEAVTGTSFSPARYEGLPVKTYKDLEINIDPYESIRIP